ncbi:DDE-type integrase/transposase/recombinase [Micromonospora globispora]|uniref:DDE-type integrase/transposase/recombinase n=1 Tax=Micromonospora globispora TaxID=1450148 RepID=UPI003C6D4DC5
MWHRPACRGTGHRCIERWKIEAGLSSEAIDPLSPVHVTVYRWVQRFTPLLADAARFSRHSPGDRWFVDETYVKVNGVWRYVYRAVDQDGQVVDVLVSARRDAAARRFFRRALSTLKVTPSAPWQNFLGAARFGCLAASVRRVGSWRSAPWTGVAAAVGLPSRSRRPAALRWRQASRRKTGQRWRRGCTAS